MTDARKYIRISKTTIDALEPQEKRYRVWDIDLNGFFVRVTPRGVKTYCVLYRPDGGGRNVNSLEYTIGKHGALTPAQARKLAEDALKAVANGEDPQASKVMTRTEPTVAELWELYRREGCGHKKPGTLRTDQSRYDSHIKPLLGGRRISTLTTADTTQFQNDVAAGKTAVAKARTGKGTTRTAPRAMGGKGTATRTVGLLGGMFTFAMNHPDTKKYIKVHPVNGVKRFKDNKWQRPLSDSELERLGEVIHESEENEMAIRIILTLALTGARKSEIQGLRRKEFIPHLSHLQLGNSKTGYKFIQLGAEAVEVLLSVDQTVESEFMFPATGKPETHYVGAYGVWRRIRERAGIPDVRLHDLRHTFATTGVLSTGNLALIGKILGHRDVKTTQQYAHLADAPVRQAAEATSKHTARALRLAKPAELTQAQRDIIDRMHSVQVDPEIIARAIAAPLAQVISVLEQLAQSSRQP